MRYRPKLFGVVPGRSHYTMQLPTWDTVTDLWASLNAFGVGMYLGMAGMTILFPTLQANLGWLQFLFGFHGGVCIMTGITIASWSLNWFLRWVNKTPDIPKEPKIIPTDAFVDGQSPGARAADD